MNKSFEVWVVSKEARKVLERLDVTCKDSPNDAAFHLHREYRTANPFHPSFDEDRQALWLRRCYTENKNA